MKLKRGISLIVLVITIIVMIILATVIVMSLSNNNVIQKANTAVTETNRKNMEEAANIALGEVLLEQDDTMTDSEYTKAIEDKMKESGVSSAELAKYNITYSNGKVVVESAGESTTSDEPYVIDLSETGDDSVIATVQDGEVIISGSGAMYDVNTANTSKISLTDAITMELYKKYNNGELISNFFVDDNGDYYVNDLYTFINDYFECGNETATELKNRFDSNFFQELRMFRKSKDIYNG